MLRVVHTRVVGYEVSVEVDDVLVDRLAGTCHAAIPKDAVCSHAALGLRDDSLFTVLLTPAM